MLLQRIRNYLQGYVLILVRGPHLERFVNLALAHGLRLWDVCRVGPDMLSCKTGVRDFKHLRPVLSKARCQVRVKRRAGLAFLTGRALRRPVFFVGLTALVCLLYVLSGFIWFVEIRGARTVPRTELGVALRKVGVYPGRRKAAVNVRYVEEELVRMVPDMAWAGLRIRGTVAILDVVEKTMPPEAKSEVRDIVAARDGIIERIRVFKGYARVVEGQTVHQGDLLITALPSEPDGAGRGAAPAGAAAGEVEARVWYHATSSALFTTIKWHRTGRSASSFRFRFGNKEFSLGRKPKFASSVISTHRRQWFPWRNGRHYVEWIRHRYDEVVQTKKMVGRAEAIRTAAAQAGQEIEKLLARRPAIRVLSRRQNLKFDADKVTVSVTIEAIENIGVATPPAGAQGR